MEASVWLLGGWGGPMPKTIHAILLLALVTCGCATARPQVCAMPARGPVLGVVFVVEGAGNYPVIATNLRDAILEQQLPLKLEEFEWSHGPGSFLADQMDYAYVRAEGHQLAARIAAFRQSCPERKVYVVAHSAGSAVVLAAAESLLPGSLDRMVLVAPAVSADYDLRPALRCCRQGLDVFTSSRDTFYLGIGVAILGTTDRQWTDAAGRLGFRPIIATSEDAALYGKLRQHPWDGCVAWTGNTGGHAGGCRRAYLKAYVLPLLRPE